MDTWQQVSISVTREAVEATANLFCEAGARNGVEIDDPLLLKELKEHTTCELDPGMAFGTGTHATTRMCIERLEELVTPNIDVYDVGTGSGILAMTAALMGARSIHAIDIDGKAVEVAKENIAKNHLSNRITVKKGNLLDDADEKADLIVANIIADIIITLLPDAFKKLRQGGLFLASGVIKERLCDVEKAARQHGFTVLDVKNRAGWTAITMRKDA